MYVIVREDGMYVSRSGSKRSYTRKLQDARTYPDHLSAEDDKCENETVLSIAQAMGKLR